MRGRNRHLFLGGMCGALIVPMLALFLIAAPGVAAQSAFTDAEGRFSFIVPDGWQEDNPDDGVIAQFQVVNPLGNFNIAVSPAPDGMTLDAFIPVALAQLKAEFDEFQPLGAKDVVLGGEQGKQLDFAAAARGQKVALSQIYAIHDGTVYILTVATPAPNIQAVKSQASNVFASWQFLSADN